MDSIASISFFIHWITMPEKVNRKFDDQYLLRLPSKLRERIKKIADRNGRSMNSEIIETLERAYSFERMINDGLDRAMDAMSTVAEEDPNIAPQVDEILDGFASLRKEIAETFVRVQEYNRKRAALERRKPEPSE